MKLKLKILTFISILFTCLFFLTPKTYAASNYSIATQFTFSSDMNIEEGFNLIKPYILYENDTISTKSYTFQVTPEGENRYHYSGIYPDGSTFSIHASIRIKENASGTYVEALKIEPYRQSIYVKGLKENKTANDCLLECWQNRFVNIKDPTYVVSTETTSRIYNHLTTFTISTGEVKNLQYFALVEKTETPSEDLGFPKEDNNISKPSNPTPPDDEEKENQNPNDTTTPPDSEQTNQGSDPFLGILICLGVLLGLVLIYLIYKGIKAIRKWLKK